MKKLIFIGVFLLAQIASNAQSFSQFYGQQFEDSIYTDQWTYDQFETIGPAVITLTNFRRDWRYWINYNKYINFSGISTGTSSPSLVLSRDVSGYVQYTKTEDIDINYSDLIGSPSLPTALQTAQWGSAYASTTSLGITYQTILGFVPYNSMNPNGYISSFTEIDPTVPSYIKTISGLNISNWDSVFGWGNHSINGYLTSVSGALLYQPKGNYLTSTTGALLFQPIGSYLTSEVDGSSTNELQTLSISGVSNLSITNGNTVNLKIPRLYSGTTDGSGNYTITFASAYSVAPNIQANLVGNSTNQYLRIVSVSTTGFTVNAYSFNTNNLLGIVSLVTTTSNIVGASVDTMITEK